MQEFVDQKKEMFHAELAYKNVQHEIADLKAKKEERARALQKSKEDLEDDNNALMEFIALDNREKHQKEALEKQTNNKRQEKEKEIKEIDMKIQQVKSEIEKHKDALNELKENQAFLLKLTPEQFYNDRAQTVKAKKEKAFKEWIASYHQDKS